MTLPDWWSTGVLIAVGWAAGGMAWDTLMIYGVGPRRAKRLILDGLRGPEGAEVRRLIVAPAVQEVHDQVQHLEQLHQELRAHVDAQAQDLLHRVDLLHLELPPKVQESVRLQVQVLLQDVADKITSRAVEGLRPAIERQMTGFEDRIGDRVADYLKKSGAGQLAVLARTKAQNVQEIHEMTNEALLEELEPAIRKLEVVKPRWAKRLRALAKDDPRLAYESIRDAGTWALENAPPLAKMLAKAGVIEIPEEMIR